MFSSLLNSAKEILENASNEPPGNAQQSKPQPTPQSHQADAAGKQEGGGDLLSGLLQAVGKSLNEGNGQATQHAPPSQPQQSSNQGGDLLSGLLQAVGKSFNEGNQQTAQQPAQPVGGDGNQSAKGTQGFNIRPEDVALITKGLGVLAQVVKDRTSAKGAEGEQATKLDTAGGRNPPSSTGNAEQGGDFLTGLMNMANQFGNANKSAPQGSSQSGFQLSQEDIARITAGLGTLATTFKEKTFGAGGNEEAVTKLDSQGGKVQVSSVVEKSATATAEQPPSSGSGDFLSGLMNVAKDVGKAFGEQNQAGSTANTSGNAAHQGGSQLSQEDIAKITAGLGSLVDTFKTKVVKKDAGEEPVTKVDSQSGQTHMSLLDRADAQAEQTLHEPSSGGNDFLSGLLNVAKDVGKVVEKSHSGTDANSSGSAGSATTQGSSQQLSQEDIAKLTAGIGSFVGALQGKATDYFQKKPVEEEKKPENEPVVDDVEGEIGRVVLPGYTASAVSKPKTT